MSRIAFVWELGSSYGHISVLLPFARRLKQRGHDVVLVLRELHNVSGILGDEIPILQAPLWLPQLNGLPEPPAQLFRDSHALRLFQCGWTGRFGERVAVSICAAWQRCDRGGSFSHGVACGAQHGFGGNDAGYRFLFSAASDADAQYAYMAECSAWTTGKFGHAGTEQHEHVARHAQG